MNLADNAASGARVILLGQGARLIVQVGGIAALARLISPADFGVFGMAMVVTSLAMLLADFGLSTASIQARDLSHAQRSNLFWLNLLIGILAAVVVSLFAGQIAGFFNEPQLPPALYAMAGGFIFNSLATQFFANASRDLRFQRLAVIDVAAPAIGVVVAVGMALVGIGVWALIAQQLVTWFMRLLLISATSPWRPGLPRRAPMRALLFFGANTFAIQALTNLTSSFDSILVGRIFGTSALGYYDKAFQLYKLPMQQLTAPLTKVALPILSHYQDDLAMMNRYLRKAQLVIAWVVGAMLAILAAGAGPLTRLFLGPGWTVSGELLSILAIGGIFQMFGYVYSWAFMAAGKTGTQLRFSVITRLLMLALIFVGSLVSLEGVAVAVSVGLLVNWIVLSLGPIPKIGIEVGPLVKVAVLPMGVHLVIGGILYATVNFVFSPLGIVDWLQVVSIGILSAFLYAATWLVTPSARAPIREVYSAVRRGR